MLWLMKVLWVICLGVAHVSQEHEQYERMECCSSGKCWGFWCGGA